MVISHMSLNTDLRAPQDFQLCRWKVAIRPELLRLRMGDAAITRKRLRLWDGCNSVTSHDTPKKGGEYGGIGENSKNWEVFGC